MDRTSLKKIEGLRTAEERALYGSDGVWAYNCAFDGEEDGESAFKESKNILAEKSFFNLRYPFWHDTALEIVDCEMTEKCRAPLWYDEDVSVRNTKMHGVKALRECRNVKIENCDILSPEFGWCTENVCFLDSRAEGEYFLFRGREIYAKGLRFKGKYSFQYVENATLENCVLDTKDAFWHAKNVTVKNCEVKGEYLAWYSENLTMIDCRISGTQPFCYCKNLKLINCSMTDADLAFEKSTVDATVTTPVVSIKNPTAGRIVLPSVGEVILTDENAKCEIVTEIKA